MISLYPFHIYISFPYSHILPYPYISHIHVSIFLSAPPVALPLVFFFIFFILWNEGGVCFSCGFLVSVLWMVFVPLLVSFFIPFFGPFLVSSFVPFFAPLRLSFRPSARFLVSFLGSLSVPPFCSFLRLGVSDRRFVGCAVFVSSSWQLVWRRRWRHHGWMLAGGVPLAWQRCHQRVASFRFSYRAGGAMSFRLLVL